MTPLKTTRDVFLFLLFAVISVLMFVPLAYMLSISLVSDDTSLKQLFTLLPTEWHWENYIAVFAPDISLWKGILNSLAIVSLAIVGQVLSSSIVAYAFARLKAPGKDLLFGILLASMVLPGEVLILSQFIIFQKLNLTNSMWPIVIPNFFGSAFNIFMLRQMITSIPLSLDEAAQLDGMGYWQIYRKIIFPLIAPGLLVIVVMTFQWNWSDIFLPLIYINDYAKSPLALMLQILRETAGSNSPPQWNMIMVGSVIFTLPTIVVFLASRKTLFSTESAGSSILK